LIGDDFRTTVFVISGLIALAFIVWVTLVLIWRICRGAPVWGSLANWVKKVFDAITSIWS
jgi:hypothetical protein